MLDRSAAALSADASEDLQLRNRYGSRWQRVTNTGTVSALRADLDNYRQLLQDAATTDNKVGRWVGGCCVR